MGEREEQLKYRISQAINKKEMCDIGISPSFFEGFSMGKVRNLYFCKEIVLLVSTDRQSSFDRDVGKIPFKGQVLNLLSKWWFERLSLKEIPTHFISSPLSRILVCEKASTIPLEFIMRAYITGSTSTSLWPSYSRGMRNYCGLQLPEGLRKNETLVTPILTPTTKGETHDELIAKEENLARNLLTLEEYELCEVYSRAMFSFGQERARESGLILVDTKYEFGRDAQGRIMVIDEVHTPESSRFWIAASYSERLAAGLEPESLDKEFLRSWIKSQCDPYAVKEMPPLPDDIVVELSYRYIRCYELLTGQQFNFDLSESDVSVVLTETALKLGSDLG